MSYPAQAEELVNKYKLVVQIQCEAVDAPFCTNAFEKGMNPSILLSAIIGQTGFFSLVYTTGLGEGKTPNSDQLYLS